MKACQHVKCQQQKKGLINTIHAFPLCSSSNWRRENILGLAGSNLSLGIIKEGVAMAT